MTKQKLTKKAKPTWVEPQVLQIDQLPTTFGACTKGKSESPISTGCAKGLKASPTCSAGGGGARP